MNKNFGFVIIAPEHNIGLIQSTLFSIKRECKEPFPPILCVVGKNSNISIVEKIREVCPVIMGGETVTSLINCGLQNITSEWAITVMEGSQIVLRSIKKMFNFVTDNKTIAFPLIVDYDRQGKPKNILSNFDKATLNGMIMHKNTIKEIGPFSENPIYISKLFWQMDAIEKGYKFRAVLGTKII